MAPSLSNIDFVVIGIYLLVVMYIGLRMARRTHSSADLFVACLDLALVAGLYTAAGGLAAVVYTDVLQAIVLLFGSFLVAYFSFGQLDFSWASVVANTASEKLSLMLPLDDPNLPWLGTLVGVPILGSYFWCTNQFVVQRVLGARSIADARWGPCSPGSSNCQCSTSWCCPG